MKNEKLDKSMFLNLDRIMSYNASWTFILGGRGIGKTYGILKKFIKDFKRNGTQFVYLRRYKEEVKMCRTKIFDAIKTDEEFKNDKFDIKGNEFYLNDEHMGRIIALSSSEYQKSVPMPDVGNVLFDEFLKDKGFTRYIPNEVEKMGELWSTIGREKKRYPRVYFVANKITSVNPYFTYFNLQLDNDQEYTYYRQRKILICQPRCEQFEQHMKETDFGILFKGTNYYEYAIENKALRDNKAFIEKLTNLKGYIPMMYFNYNNQRITVWFNVDKQMFYVNNKEVGELRNIYINLEDLQEDGVYSPKFPIRDILRNSVSLGMIRYENQEIKTLALDIFIKIGIK